MRLTNEQVAELQKKGLSPEKIALLAAQKGYDLPDNRDFLHKAEGITSKLFAGQKVGQAIGTLGGYLYTKAKDKIQGTNVADYYDLSAPTPLQVAGDVAKGAVQVAGAKMPVASSVMGKTAQFGVLGGASSGANAIAEGKDAESVAKDTVSGALVSALVGFSFGVAEKALKGATNLTSKTGEKIQYNVINPSKADINDGFDIKTIEKYNLGGSLKDTFSKGDAALDDLTRQLNEKLAENKVPVDLNAVYDRTSKRLLGNQLENFGSNASMDKAVEKLREEVVRISGNNGLVTIPEAQVVKRASGHFGSWMYGMADPDSTASQKVYNTFYNELKNEIENVSPEGVREINKQMSEIIPVMNAVIRRIPVAERNAAISLTDIITLTGASLEPTALSLTLINRLSKMGTVGSALAKTRGLGQSALQGAEQITQSLITR